MMKFQSVSWSDHIRRLSRLTIGAFGFVCLICVGCNSERPLPPLAPVKGTVTLDDKKLTSGQVSLVPEAVEAGKAPPPSSGKINSDGTYEINTGGKPGAPLGKYKVKVTPDMAAPTEKKGEPPFNMKYYDHTKSGLGFEVVENAPSGRYDLKLSK